jgi:hypothetical protein
MQIKFANPIATALVNSTAIFGRLADILPRSRRANVAKELVNQPGTVMITTYLAATALIALI